MADNKAVQPKSWGETFKSFIHPRVMTMLFLGFSAGIPILLIFSSLNLWLGEAGVERKTVTYFSWAALGYSFKFIWAPLIDKLPLPILTRLLGRRRSWMLVSQVLIIIAIAWMGLTDPAVGVNPLTMMAIGAVMLGFSSATQDVVIDAYRIESGTVELQAMMSSSYMAGYRIAMLVAGAGSLFIASGFGSEKEHYLYSAWRNTYFIMAATMLVGIVTTLIMDEPERKTIDKHAFALKDYIGLIVVFVGSVSAFVAAFYFSSDLLSSYQQSIGGGAFVGFLFEVVHMLGSIAVAGVVGFILVKLGLVNKDMASTTWVEPIVDFFKRYGTKTAWLLLSLIGLYRISDIVLGVISNVFYQEMGYTKIEIGMAVKTVGVFAVIFGGYFGGIVATRIGVMKTLLWGGIAAALTNLLFMLMAYVGRDQYLFYSVTAADNFAAGFASAAFVAFLSSLTNISFTAVQYAIFSSLMTLLPKVIGGYSGTIVDAIGYQGFFIFTTVIGIPVLWLIILAGKHLKVKD